MIISAGCNLTKVYRFIVKVTRPYEVYIPLFHLNPLEHGKLYRFKRESMHSNPQNHSSESTILPFIYQSLCLVWTSQVALFKAEALVKMRTIRLLSHGKQKLLLQTDESGNQELCQGFFLITLSLYFHFCGFSTPLIFVLVGWKLLFRCIWRGSVSQLLVRSSTTSVLCSKEERIYILRLFVYHTFSLHSQLLGGLNPRFALAMLL